MPARMRPPTALLGDAALKLLEARLEGSQLVIDAFELIAGEAGVSGLHPDVEVRRAGQGVETSRLGGILRTHCRIEQFVGHAQIGDEHGLAIEAGEEKPLRG
jgi:hypothetical protein